MADDKGKNADKGKADEEKASADRAYERGKELHDQIDEQGEDRRRSSEKMRQGGADPSPPRTHDNRSTDNRSLREARSRNIVYVACKLPHGLVLQLYESSLTEEGKPVHIASGDAVKINGANAPIVGKSGYGLTEVDAEFWDAWVKANPKFPALRNGLLFAESRRDRTLDRAVDMRAAPTGVEPLNPDAPGKGLERVPEKEQKAAAGSMQQNE